MAAKISRGRSRQARRAPRAATYRLLGSDGVERASATPGTLAGNRRLKIYGRLDCSSALRALVRGYARRRVFFRNERAAIVAGYRPCGTCLRARYREWKRGRVGAGQADGSPR